MHTIDDIELSEKKVLVRVDFNVPLNANFEVTDQTRLKAAVPTIQKIIQEGGSAILLSHLGRPKSGPEDKFSLRHVQPALSKLLGLEVKFVAASVGEEAEKAAELLQAGEVLLLENVRFHKEETEGDEIYARRLAQLGEVYVNDAFGTAHRAHASTTVVAQFFETRACGYVMSQELENARRVLELPDRPFTAIMGGAKISDKLLIIERLLDKVDHLIIGGGMSFTFFKALGGKIGSSLVEEDKLGLAKVLVQKAKEKGVELHLPKDSVIADGFSNDAKFKDADNHDIPDGWMGLDIGREARVVFRKVIETSKTILWNGPMGVFEMSNFAGGTQEVAKAVVAATERGAFSLVGGGDSAAAVNQLGYGDRVSYVSTGGGALLEYMEGRTLPGVAALEP